MGDSEADASPTPHPTRRRPSPVDMRAVLDTLLYQNRTGCQWDMLPHDLLPKSTVYDYFAQWRDDGTWAKIVSLLRTRVRVQEGREPTPSAACIDSQSVKTTEVGGAERGYDGGKKINGRKRHVLVDTIGLLLVVLITSAALDDGAAAIKLLAQISAEDFPRLTVIFGDSKYHNHDLARVAQRASARMADRSEETAGGKPRALSRFPSAGWWNAPTLGMAAPAATAKIMNASPNPVPRRSI